MCDTKEKPNQYNDDERQYLQMMQSNIERMANNSANCKTWLVTLLTGFMAISCGFESLHWWLLLAAVPIAMFWYLDGFYLSLERKMRNRQKDFLNKQTKDGDEYNKASYNFEPLEKEEDEIELGLVKTTGQWWTKSVWPFYLTMMVVIIVVTLVVNWTSLCGCGQ